MAFLFKSGTLTQPTSSGNQSVTGIGFRPKAVIFFGNQCTADGAINDACASFGVGVLSTQRRCVGYTSARITDGFTNQVSEFQNNASCIRYLDALGTLLSSADFVSSDVDGFTLNWTSANATQRRCHYVALGGNDLTNAFTGSFTSKTTNGTQAYTGVGFKPDCVIIFTSTGIASDPFSSTANNVSWTIGWASSSIARAYSASRINGGVEITSTRKRQLTSKCLSWVSATGVLRECDFASFDSNGFTLDWTTTNGVGAYFYALCLKGGKYASFAFKQPTSGTPPVSQSVTGIGFRPIGALLSTVQSVTIAGNSSGASYSLGACESASSRRCLSIVANNNEDATTFDVATRQYMNSAKVIETWTFDTISDTLTSSVDLQSLDSDGLSLSWTTLDATEREIIGLAFGNRSIAAFQKPRLRPGIFKPAGERFSKRRY